MQVISGGPGEGPFDVSVVIPLYRSRAVVLDQVARWPGPEPGIRAELVYVDDRCPESSGDAVPGAWAGHRHHPDYCVAVVRNAENRGFAGACNAGARAARGRVLVFLNADAVPEAGWLAPLLDALASDPAAGIAGNLQLKEGGEWHGTIDGAGSEWSWAHDRGNFLHIGRHSLRGAPLLRGPLRPEEMPADLMRRGEREMVTGCCLAIPAALFADLGGFDERYRVGYWEDSELCMSARALGRKVLFEPASVVWHKLSHSGAANHPHQHDNRTRFFHKWVVPGRLDALVGAKRPDGRHQKDMRPVCIRRAGARGDVLLAAGVAKAVRRMFPRLQVHFATECPDMIRNHPAIHRPVTIAESERMRNRYQAILDLDGAYERRPGVPILRAFAEEVGAAEADMGLHIHRDPCRAPLPPRFVAIHAGRTAWVGRDWTDEGFAEVARRLRRAGREVVVVGGRGDRALPGAHDLRGRSIYETADIIGRCDFYFGIDSMPMHIAQVLQRPALAFFGCVDPALRVFSPMMEAIAAPGLACLGCHHRQPPPATVLQVCARGDRACEASLSPDDVWARIAPRIGA